jgi:hypothetical protein
MDSELDNGEFKINLPKGFKMTTKYRGQQTVVNESDGFVNISLLRSPLIATLPGQYQSFYWFREQQQLKNPKKYLMSKEWKWSISKKWELENIPLKSYYEINKNSSYAKELNVWLKTKILGYYVHPDLVHHLIDFYLDTRIDNENNKEWCYLIQLMNEVNQNTPVFKVGKSTNITERMKVNEYKNCKIFSINQVIDCTKCETETKRLFRRSFQAVRKSSKSNYGSELFSGDI